MGKIKEYFRIIATKPFRGLPLGGKIVGILIYPAIVLWVFWNYVILKKDI